MASLASAILTFLLASDKDGAMNPYQSPEIVRAELAERPKPTRKQIARRFLRSLAFMFVMIGLGALSLAGGERGAGILFLSLAAVGFIAELFIALFRLLAD